MSKIAFAVEHIKTSQGYVDAAHPLPALDIPSEELENLLAEKKVVLAHHASPLALRAHEIRKAGDRAAAEASMRWAAENLSPEGEDVVASEVPDEPPADAGQDPKPEDGAIEPH